MAPAVVSEKITKVRHEEAQTAIDREVHQDHYHTSIQPVKVLLVSLATEEVQITNLEIREELAIVVVSAVMRIE